MVACADLLPIPLLWRSTWREITATRGSITAAEIMTEKSDIRGAIRSLGRCVKPTAKISLVGTGAI